MTHATFPHRAIRTLAVAGALTLVTAPLMATSAFAAPNPGDIKILEANGTAAHANDPQITGCAFQVKLENAPKGTYSVMFDPQEPTKAIPDVAGPQTFTITQDKGWATNPYVFFSPTSADLPKADYHVKVDVTNSSDHTVNSKVFWVRDCVAKPMPKPGPSGKPSEPAKPGPQASASVPGKVNSGVDGGEGGLVALGVGGVAIAGLGALGLRRRGRR